MPVPRAVYEKAMAMMANNASPGADAALPPPGAPPPSSLAIVADDEVDTTIEHTGDVADQADTATLRAALNKRHSQIHMVVADELEAAASPSPLPAKRKDSGVGLVGRLHGLPMVVAAGAAGDHMQRSGSFHLGARSPRAGMQL